MSNFNALPIAFVLRLLPKVILRSQSRETKAPAALLSDFTSLFNGKGAQRFSHCLHPRPARRELH